MSLKAVAASKVEIRVGRKRKEDEDPDYLTARYEIEPGFTPHFSCSSSPIFLKS